MMSIVLLAVFIGVCRAGLGLDITNEASNGFAVDVNSLTPASTFGCYRSSGYSAAFIRVYKETGEVDDIGIKSVKNALSTNFGVEVYASPAPSSIYKGYQQFDQIMNTFKQNGINLKMIWLKVTNPISWPNSQNSNSQFIYSFLQRAVQYGVGVGLYTNWYDWQQITANNAISMEVKVWYWHVNGIGMNANTGSGMNDFVPFSYFHNPVVKEYGRSINLCNSVVNFNSFLTKTSTAVKAAADSTPSVGSLGLSL